jgi:hypothetical protein
MQQRFSLRDACVVSEFKIQLESEHVPVKAQRSRDFLYLEDRRRALDRHCRRHGRKYIPPANTPANRNYARRENSPSGHKSAPKPYTE